MAYFALLWKARTIEKYRLNYEREKLNSIRITQTQNPKQTFYQRICQCNLNTRKRLSNAFLRHYPRGSAVYNFFYYLRTDLTFPNFVMKSVIGFVGGIILTYLCFMFFVFQLSISLMHATFMSSIIGVLLTLGLAFSFRVRCMVFLLIPQFFSRVGRYTLTCYALVLILTGPATNTLKNSEVLSESLACCQEQIKNSIHQVNESMSSPFHCMNDSIRAMIQSIKLLAHKMKTICIRVHRLVFSITHTLQSSFHWLSTTVQTCNKKLGTPYQRCTKAVNNAITECQVTLGPKLSWVCDVAQVTKLVCSPIKHLKSFCHVIDFANKNILVVINGKLKSFYERLNLMLYLEVNVHHSFSFNSNSSKSASQVAAGIVTEIRNRADPLLTWLSWSSCVTSLSLLLILFRAKYYQFMFETRPRFDNRYITKELRDLDLKRLRHRKETILPLNRREEVRYIKTTSFRLLASEKIHISRSAVSMAYTTFKLMIHMVADYSLYWVLMTIRYHGRFQTPAQPGLRNTGMYVSGSGFLSKIFRSVIRSIDLPLTAQTPSPITCLPAPYPPDFQRYSQIGVLVFLLWFSALMEPYGLRLRHVIMGLYRPERAKARAVWLFNRIQKTRGSFMKFARRKLHREYKYSSESKHTFRLWLYNHVPFSWLRYLLGIKAEKPHCFLCGIIEDCDEMEDELTHCLTPTCPGTYCIRCFADIGQLCTICLSPADYGDMSDVSLEKGSSDDEDNSEESSFGRSNPTFKSQKSNLRSNRSRWSLFPRMGKKGRHRQDIESRPILYESDAMGVKDSSNTKTEENSVKNYNIVSRALMIRHRKYSELDSIGARRKEIMTLHQDGLYFVCWTKQHISRNDSYCIMMSEGYHGTCNKHCFNISRKNSKNKSLDTSLDSDKNATSTVTTDNSITKLLRRFRCLRRYSLMSRSTQRMSKKSRKALTIRSNSSKNSRSSSRKRRKKGYWSERNLNSTGKTLSGNCKCNSNIMSTFKINNTRSLDAIDSKRHKICSKHLVPKCRSKSEPGFLNKVAQILRNARRRRFEVNAAMKFKKLSKKTAMDNDNNDDNEKEQVSPNKSGAKDEKSEVLPIKNKENDEETPVKLADSKKNSQKTEKLLNLLGVYCKTTQMFTQPINFNKFFKKTEVPEQHAKTNYKRRKKEKPVKEKTSADVKKRSDKEAARKYRLSTYLSELDWKRKKCKFRNKCGINDDSIEVQDASHCLEKDGPNTKGDVNKKVCMANKTLWLKRGLYSKVYKKWSPNDKLQISSSEGPVVLAVGTIDASMTNNKGSNLSVNFRSHQSCQRVLDFTLASESDEYDISRVIDYYRSLGHHDFDGSDMLLRANEGYLEQIVSEQKKKLASGGDRPSMERPGSTMHQERSVETVNLKKSSGSRKEKKLKQIYTECKSKHSLKRKSTRQAFTETTAVKLKAAYSETAKDLSPELDLMRKSKSRAVCTEIERKKSISFSDAGKGSKALDIKPQTSKHSKTEVTKPETDKSPSIFRKAITTVKGWFSKSEKKKKKQDKQTKVDAEAVVRPVVQTVSCQYTVSEPKYQIQNTTAHMCQMKEAEQCISHELLQDAEVDAGREVCTCATQFTTHSKNVGTYYKCKIHRNANIAVRDAGTIHYNAVKNTRRDVATMHRNCCKMMQNTCIQCQLPAVTKSPLMRRPPLEDNSVDTFDTTDTMETLSSIRSDDDTAKTDTTVYCLKCDGEAGRNKLQRCKVNVVTKSNRGTCTDPKKIRDASTVTSDWWSPMSDRRTQKNKVSYLNLRSRKKTFREKGMATDGRVVKFKSNAQIIPSLHTDVLSPSRYLLESQRYYNELFNSKFYSPHLLPINSYQPRDGERVHRQPHPNRHQARRWRNYRAKRLDDSHSPRKMILPREHCNEELWLAENVHSKRQTNAGNKKQRTNKKLNIPKKSRNSYRHVTDRSIIDVKTGQVNLVSRRVASSEERMCAKANQEFDSGRNSRNRLESHHHQDLMPESGQSSPQH